MYMCTPALFAQVFQTVNFGLLLQQVKQLTFHRCGVSQNEAVITGASTRVELNILKCINSLFTLLCILLIVRKYWLKGVLARLIRNMHEVVREEKKRGPERARESEREREREREEETVRACVCVWHTDQRRHTDTHAAAWARHL